MEEKKKQENKGIYSKKEKGIKDRKINEIKRNLLNKFDICY